MKTVVMTAWDSHAFDEDNLHRMAHLAGRLKQMGADWHLAVGSYKGAVEQSVVIEGLTEHGVLTARIMAGDYHQECILVVDEDGTASLVEPDGSTQHAGGWREVSQTLAVTKEGWTTYGGRWFIVEPVVEGN